MDDRVAAGGLSALADHGGAAPGRTSHYPPIDYQGISYYSAPKPKEGPKRLDEVDPEIRETYEKLGIPLAEQEILAGVAVDDVFDTVSVATTFRAKLAELGRHLLLDLRGGPRAPRAGPQVPRLGRAARRQLLRGAELGGLLRRLASSTCPRACAARWSCRPTSASTPQDTGQFERTLIVADEGAYVSYLEGCTAPMRDENQLHAAVVELVALDDAEIKYSTVQNWYPGDKDGKGGIYNFVTKRGACRGRKLEDHWTQVETGSAITWKYPPACCRATTRSASSTRWPSPTTASRPTPAPR